MNRDDWFRTILLAITALVAGIWISVSVHDLRAPGWGTFTTERGVECVIRGDHQMACNWPEVSP